MNTITADAVLDAIALLNPETSIFIQKRHPYTGNPSSKTSGHSQNVFLNCGDDLAVQCLSSSS